MKSVNCWMLVLYSVSFLIFASGCENAVVTGQGGLPSGYKLKLARISASGGFLKSTNYRINGRISSPLTHTQSASYQVHVTGGN